MQKAPSLFAAVSVTAAVAGCISSNRPPIARAVDEAELRNSQLVQVQGVVGSWHEGVNLYAPSREECIGLLVTEAELPRLRAQEGKKVTVSGKLEAQGCGRDGICDEHVCGPAILSSVQLIK